MEYYQNLEQAFMIAGLLGILLGCGLAYWFLRHHIAHHVYEEGFKAGWSECDKWMASTLAVIKETLGT